MMQQFFPILLQEGCMLTNKLILLKKITKKVKGGIHMIQSTEIKPGQCFYLGRVIFTSALINH